MTRPRVLAVVVLVVLVAVPLAAGVSTGETARQQQAPNASGDYTRQYLTKGGTHAGGASSTRLLDGHETWVQIQYEEAKPLGSDKKYLEAGAKLRTNDIKVVSGAIGDVEPMSLEVVSWQKQTRQVETDKGIISKQVAANVSSQSYRIEHGFYKSTNVTLPAHFDQQWQITMLLKDQSGDVVARWRFQHKSNPLMKAAPGVDSKGDIHAFGFLNYLLPGLVVTLIGKFQAPKVLRRTKVGPNQSAMVWAALLFALFLIATMALFYQLSTLFVHAGYLGGAMLGIVAFLGMVTVDKSKLKKANFIQPKIVSKTPPDADDEEESKPGMNGYNDREHYIHRENSTVYVISPGFINWIARYWADPPKFDERDYMSIDRSLDPDDSHTAATYWADPIDADSPVSVDKCWFTFDPNLMNGLSDDQQERYDDTMSELKETDTISASVQSAIAEWKYSLKRVNWGLVSKSSVAFAAVWLAFSTIGLSTTGLVLGAVPFLVMSLHATDGRVEFEAAPPMMKDCRVTRAEEEEQYPKLRTHQQVVKFIKNRDTDAKQFVRELKHTFQQEEDRQEDKLRGFSDLEDEIDAASSNGSSTAELEVGDGDD